MSFIFAQQHYYEYSSAAHELDFNFVDKQRENMFVSDTYIFPFPSYDGGDNSIRRKI